MIGFWYAYSAASNPDKLPYDLSFWRAGASVVGTALGAWLTYRKSKAAIPVTAATAVSSAVLGVLNKRKSGSYATRTWGKGSFKETVFNRMMPAAHAVESVALAGVAVAVRAHARRNELVTPLRTPLFSFPRYPLARKLGLYFMVFSLLGHWGEILFCTGIKYGIFKGGYDRENHMLWDQWLFPFPAEGTAAVLAELVLTPAKHAVTGFVESHSNSGFIPRALSLPLALAGSFLVNQVACTAVDYATGMVANRNYELWDYRDMRFNFQGQICLQNSLFYSVVATWGVWWLLPVFEKAMTRMGGVALDGLLVGLGSFFAFLELLYHVLPNPDDADVPDEAELLDEA